MARCNACRAANRPCHGQPMSDPARNISLPFPTDGRRRLVLALLVSLPWFGFTVLGGASRAAGQGTLLETVGEGVGFGFLGAAGVLLAAVFAFRWHDVGLNLPADLRSLRVAWFPALFVVAFIAIANTLGLPPPRVIGVLLFNCLVVGLSEELMFRGVLLQALRANVGLWPAILWSSLLFGSVHAVNVVVTGELAMALLQAMTATLSAFLFVAIRLRTGSLLPAIAVHGLWDFGIFLMLAAGDMSVAPGSPPAEATPPDPFLAVLPALPNFLYGMYLLRNVSRQPALPPPA